MDEAPAKEPLPKRQRVGLALRDLLARITGRRAQQSSVLKALGSEITSDSSYLSFCRCNMLLVPAGRPFRPMSGRVYEGRALFALSVTNPLRKRAIDLVENPWFDRVVLVIILANCCTMAATDPLATKVSSFNQVAEWVFTAVFTAEMCVKVATPRAAQSSHHLSPLLCSLPSAHRPVHRPPSHTPNSFGR